MTQTDAKNAVNNIKLKLVKLLYFVDRENEVQEILNDVIELETQLSVRHFIHAPNCRRATPEELDRLCQSSNVFVFPAVA